MKSLLLSLLLCCLLSPTQAQEYVSLFDGKTLEGWTSSTDKPESFQVKDGVLIVKGGRAHLFYTGADGKADFRNFELQLKAKTTTGSNSGVYFHTEYQADGWPNEGFEAQVNSTHSDAKKTGSLYGIANVWVPGDDAEPFGVRVSDNGEIFLHQNEAPSTDDEWFDYLIRVEGKHITIKVNGVTTVDWTQPRDWSKDRRIGHGTIALQAHDPNSETHYKDIKIRELP